MVPIGNQDAGERPAGAIDALQGAAGGCATSKQSYLSNNEIGKGAPKSSRHLARGCVKTTNPKASANTE